MHTNSPLQLQITMQVALAAAKLYAKSKIKHSKQTDTLYTHLTCGLQKLQNFGFK